MLRTLISRICWVALAGTLIVIPAVSGQQARESAAAPVPAQIVTGRKVFISNTGADLAAQAVFKRAGEPEQAYNRFYAAMQTWGRYEIVSAPGEADMVFEIRFAAPMYYDGTFAVYAPQFGLSILDAKTHFMLWSLAEPVEGAYRKTTWLKNFDHGLEALMNDLKKLSMPVMANGEFEKR